MFIEDKQIQRSIVFAEQKKVAFDFSLLKRFFIHVNMSLLPCLRGREEKSCFALFQGNDDSLYITLVDAATEKEIKAVKIDGQNLKQFIHDIPKLFGKKLKVVLFQFYGFQENDYKYNIDLCQAFRTRLNALNIPHYFTSHLQLLFGSVIMKANITSKIGERIIIARASSSTIGFLELEFTKFGYKKTDLNIHDINTQAARDAACNMIIELCKSHKKVVIDGTLEKAFVKFLKNFLKLDNLIFVEIDQNFTNFTTEMSKWFLDKSYTKFFIIPVCEGKYFVLNCAGGNYISIDEHDTLPATKSSIISKSIDVLLLCDLNTFNKCANTLHKMEQKCHGYKVTLSVDEENFPTFTILPIMLSQIQAFPSMLNAIVNSKFPIIGFCDTFSVICVHKDDENGYQFVDAWNGIYGTELVISFCNKKPLFGKAALSSSTSTISYDLQKNGKNFTFQVSKRPIYGDEKKKPYKPANEIDQHEPGYLVYDIIKIMSMPPDNIKVKDLWGFRITKDDENPVLLEFMNHENELKLATPALLMALLIKEHIKVIKTEIGEKPKKLGFYILNNTFNSEESQRIKYGVKEACEMLKIGSDFIDVQVCNY